MAMAINPITVLQNLSDAGIDTDGIAEFSSLLETGSMQEQMKMLARQRTKLLDKLHDCQRHLDCLDYLIYTMKKEGLSNEPV